jgi:transposase
MGGQSSIGRGGNAKKHKPNGKASAPEGIADWETGGIGKKNGYPNAPLEVKKAETLFRQGYSVAQARVEIPSISRTCMYDYKRKFDTTGFCAAGAYGKPKFVHRKLTSFHKLYLVMAIAVSMQISCECWGETLMEEFGLDISGETVRRDLRESGISFSVTAPIDDRAFLPANIQTAAEWEVLKPAIPANLCCCVDETSKKPSDVEKVGFILFHCYEHFQTQQSCLSMLRLRSHTLQSLWLFRPTLGVDGWGIAPSTK